MTTLESDLRLIRLEWQESYDKITKAFERWRKRVQQLQALEPENGSNQSPDTSKMSVEELTRYARSRGVL